MRADRRARDGRIDILLVSESPERIVAAEDTVRPFGIRLVGCVGPAQAPCYLEKQNHCPLADNARVVLVDAPPLGRFMRHWQDIPAGLYAERLAAAHPETVVILCGLKETDGGGPSGEVAVSNQDALTMVQQLSSLLVSATTGSVAS